MLKVAVMMKLAARTIAMALLAFGAMACGDPSVEDDEEVSGSAHDLLLNSALQKEYENATIDSFKEMPLDDLKDVGSGWFTESDAERDIGDTRAVKIIPRPGHKFSATVHYWGEAHAKIWRATSTRSYYILQAFYKDGQRAITQIYLKDDDKLDGQRVLTARETMDGQIEWLAPQRLRSYAEEPTLDDKEVEESTFGGL